jgi:putative transposase
MPVETAGVEMCGNKRRRRKRRRRRRRRRKRKRRRRRKRKRLLFLHIRCRTNRSHLGGPRHECRGSEPSGQSRLRRDPRVGLVTAGREGAARFSEGWQPRESARRWEDVSDLPPLRLRHSVSRLVVHMVWATRDRCPWLEASVDPVLSRLVHDKCVDMGCRAVTVGNAFDHVHALIAYPPTVSVAAIAHRIKGATGRLLALRLPPGFEWQAGYFAESVSDLAAVQHYVARQRAHHSFSNEPEPWEVAVLG